MQLINEKPVVRIAPNNQVFDLPYILPTKEALRTITGGPIGKRLFDLTRTIPALFLLGPVMIGIAWLVRRNLGSPVLFRHQRPGRGGRPFILLKFRTMTDARDAEGKLLPDAQRATRFGRLRAVSQW